MSKGKLTFHPPGTPFELDHPFATPQIIFGAKRPNSSTANSPAPSAPEPTPDSALKGMDDPEVMKLFQDKMDAHLRKVHGYEDMDKPENTPSR